MDLITFWAIRGGKYFSKHKLWRWDVEQGSVVTEIAGEKSNNKDPMLLILHVTLV